LTVSMAIALPPAPEQVNVKVAALVSGPTCSEPLGPLSPDQAPLPVQLLASLELQFNIVDVPLSTNVFAALRFAVGLVAGGCWAAGGAGLSSGTSSAGSAESRSSLKVSLACLALPEHPTNIKSNAATTTDFTAADQSFPIVIFPLQG
jgi:hypothetical protein